MDYEKMWFRFKEYVLTDDEHLTTELIKEMSEIEINECSNSKNIFLEIKKENDNICKF